MHLSNPSSDSSHIQLVFIHVITEEHLCVLSARESVRFLMLTCTVQFSFEAQRGTCATAVSLQVYEL